MTFLRNCGFHAILFLLLTASLSIGGEPQAQVASADLTGTISPSKAVVAGTTVTATNVNTGVVRSTVSDATGEYRIALLQPGEYDLMVEAPGFAAQRRKGIILTVGQFAVINIDLQVGAETGEIAVTASAPVVEMERTNQSETITQRPIQDLPIDGRYFLTFSTLTPGVVEENPAVTDSLLPQLPTSRLSFAGQNGRSNNITIDGVDNNDVADKRCAADNQSRSRSRISNQPEYLQRGIWTSGGRRHQHCFEGWYQSVSR